MARDWSRDALLLLVHSLTGPEGRKAHEALRSLKASFAQALRHSYAGGWGTGGSLGP